MVGDRNLLFGVLALQADLIDAGQFAEVCSAWAARKSTPLADLLQERGWISDEDRADVEKLLERKLRKHGGDVQASLTDAVGSRTLDAIASVQEPDVRQSLAVLTRRDGDGETLGPTLAHEAESRERYTLSRLHARGGLGQVWLALDADLGRQVALKEVRPEREDDQSVVARFLEEAKITGQLEHPGIVPVYELARRSTDGHPYYTMRFVRGRTLSDAIGDYHRRREAGNTSPLDLAALLNAFVGVCQAVAYAHSRKVIHRDLKPQNVVLGDFGEVVVLDWGLAKLVDGGEGSAAPSLVALDPGWHHDATVQGQVLGTPAYMAPEQAEGRLDRLDRRTDIHGLGAIFYEILTGRPPFGGEDTREVLARVVHENPTPARSVVASTPPALEAVCLRALAKRPEDRYDEAGMLAAEVQRFLAGEPVAAYPEPLLTRAGRWVRKHRTLTTAAAAVGLVVLAASLVAYRREAIHAARLVKANQEVQRQRDEARRQGEEAARQRDLAAANFATARRAVDDFLTAFSESRLLKSPLPGVDVLRRQLLELALPYYRDFVAQHRDDPALRAQLAGAALRLGRIRADVGGGGDAFPSFELARDLYNELLRAAPGNPAYRHELALSCKEFGKYLLYAGRKQEALDATRRANELEAGLVRDHPEVPDYRRELALTFNNIGVMSMFMGRPDDELDAYRKAIAAWEGSSGAGPMTPEFRRGLAKALSNYGVNRLHAGKLEEARDRYLKSVALIREASTLEPDDGTNVNDLILYLGNLGEVQYQLGRLKPALEVIQESLNLSRDLLRQNPTVTLYHDTLATNLNMLADIQLGEGDVDAALKSCREALDQARLVARNPHFQDSGLRMILAARVGIAHALSRRGQVDEGLKELREVLADPQLQGLDHPEALYTVARGQALAGSVSVAGRAAPAPGRRVEADRHFAEAVKTLSRAVSAGYRNVQWIARDPAFRSLRERDDFRRLVADLEKASATPG